MGMDSISAKIAAQRRSARRKQSCCKAVRRHCLKCAGDWRAVQGCPATKCDLYPHRFGVRPETAARRGKDVGP